MVGRRYEARLAEHRPHLPDLDLGDQVLFDELRTEAAAVSSLDQLDLPGTGALREAATALAQALSDLPAGDRIDTIRPSAGQLAQDLSVWRWGLHPRLLDIAENYLGLPVRYWGPDVRRDVSHRGSAGVRQWHRDVEDHRQLKILIWLTDVGNHSGAYEYVRADYTNSITRALNYVSGFVTDAAIANLAPRSERVLCPGPAWTAVFTDPARLFHRANPGATHDRYSLTFSYTSHHQLKTHHREPLSTVQLGRLKESLSPRQLDALPPLG
jgi:hypothetical protein